MDFLYKLEGVKEHFIEVGKLIVDPDIISDMKRYVKLTKEYKDLEVIVQTYDANDNPREYMVKAAGTVLVNLFQRQDTRPQKRQKLL